MDRVTRAAALRVMLFIAACTSGPRPADTTQSAAGAGSTPAAERPDTIGPPGEGRPRDTVRDGTSRVLVEALAVNAWRPGSPASCGLASPPRSGGDVTLFFGCTPTNGPVLGAIPARRLSVGAGAEAKEAAIAALLRGPTAAERAAGYLSNFGERSAGTPFTIRMRGDTSVVDLDSRIRDVPMIFVGRTDVAQLVATLGQFPDVRFVIIRVGGHPLCRVLGEC